MPKTPTILVVDDENIIRNILAKLIHALGYSVLQASHSTEAVSMIRQHKPELVLLDIMMPGVNSMEVMHTVRTDATLQHIAIVLISAIDDLDTVSSYIDAGADDFLPKPFNSALLSLKIRNALERVSNRQQLQSGTQPSDTFYSQLAHDLNNGLTGIMMTAELLLMEHTTSPSKEYLEEIISSTEQISAMIKQRRSNIEGKNSIS